MGIKMDIKNGYNKQRKYKKYKCSAKSQIQPTYCTWIYDDRKAKITKDELEQKLVQATT